MARRIVRLRIRPLLDSFRALAAAGSRLPLVSVLGYRVSYNAATGRLYAGGRDQFLGQVLASGIFRPSKHCRAGDIERISAIIENTIQVVKAAAPYSDRCAICNRPLDPRDQEVGIGRGCWETGKFGTYERRTIAGGRSSVRIAKPSKRKPERRLR